MSNFNFTLSDSAAARIQEIIAQQKLTSDHFLRLSVLGGGCSGFQYDMKMDDEITDDDIVIESKGSKVVIDDVSQPFLTDSTLEYEQSLGAAMFKVKNPNASSSCGCGVSFDMKE